MARPPAIADNAVMTLDLFPDEPAVERRDEPLAPGALLLRG
jgi:hypothetical protein